MLVSWIFSIIQVCEQKTILLNKKNIRHLTSDGIRSSLYAKPDNYLAGVAFSCISRVSPVNTSGVWSLRNLPPQIIIWVEPLYYMFNIDYLLFFVKRLIVSKPLLKSLRTFTYSSYD